jgi:hypothetical protein
LSKKKKKREKRNRVPKKKKIEKKRKNKVPKKKIQKKKSYFLVLSLDFNKRLEENKKVVTGIALV